ncbi:MULTISPECIES: hypothetical protein [Oscillatoriales]|uniref:Uncharacterized protein n=1 Tax=Aerosakkonema funiforme FACHB-1375 TaxID=2949571 RepID=A0A926VMC8_9CYAN|nr:MULTISPECIES: hypothetical protein [Oscillatoriales]MBD2185472.1 hypothetical protein [Aerosakkonema funiforme FACHB-1375]
MLRKVLTLRSHRLCHSMRGEAHKQTDFPVQIEIAPQLSIVRSGRYPYLVSAALYTTRSDITV